MTIDCPRTKSLLTPCVLRDGIHAIGYYSECIECKQLVGDLLKDLAEKYAFLKASYEEMVENG